MIRRFLLFAALLFSATLAQAGLIKTLYSVTVAGSRESLFAKALLTVYGEDATNEQYQQLKVNTRRYTFEHWFEIAPEFSGAKGTYGGKATFTVSSGQITVQLTDLYVKRGKGILGSSSKLVDEESKNEKKNAQLIEANQAVEKYVASMLEAMAQSEATVSDKYWSYIMKGDICKGMSTTECRVSKGNPVATNENPDGSMQWNYGLYYMVYFKNGRVESVVKP